MQFEGMVHQQIVGIVESSRWRHSAGRGVDRSVFMAIYS